MPFELVHRRRFSPGAKPLRENEARVNKSGLIILRKSALARADMTGDVVFLVDATTARLGIRKVQADDPADTHTPPRKVKTLQEGLVAFNGAAALRQGGFMSEAGAVFHGTLPLVTRKSEPPLLMIMLEGTGSEDGD